MDINLLYKYKYVKYKKKYINLKNNTKELQASVKQQTVTPPTIIITVPHSKCNDMKENICDQTSLRVATKLRKLFQSKFNVIFLDTNIHRLECDLNRRNCGNANEEPGSSYYKSFRTCVKDNPNAIHLDIHSYPNRNSFKSMGDKNIIILANQNNWVNSIKMFHELSEYIKIGVLRGGDNYLTNYSSGYENNNNKLRLSLLLEFFDDDFKYLNNTKASEDLAKLAEYIIANY